MRLSLRTLLPLSLALAMAWQPALGYAAGKTGRAVPASTTTEEAEADEAVDEPLLVIPKSPAAPKAKPTAPVAKGALQTSKQLSAPAKVARLPETPTPRSQADANVVPASAIDEEAAAEPSGSAFLGNASGHKLVAHAKSRGTDDGAPPLLETAEAEPVAQPAKPTVRRSPAPKAQPAVTAAQRSAAAAVPRSHTATTPGWPAAPDVEKPSRRASASFAARSVAQEEGSEMVPTPEVSEDETIVYGDEGPSLFGGGDEGFSFGMGGRRWSVIAAGEGMLIRPHFSQATGMSAMTVTQNGAGTAVTENLINFNPGYQGAFRAYVGLRDAACGDEFRVSYFNYNGSDNLTGTADANTSYCDFLCNTTPNPGDTVSTKFGLNANLWDIECVRPFFCMPPCSDPCGPRCHPWDLRWFGGVRFAYINHDITSLVTDQTAPDGLFSRSSAHNKFTGFGPRLGLQGRKFFGPTARWSIYTRGAGSLLVGNVYQDVSSSTASSSLPVTNGLVSRDSRIIPVAELELGATWRILPRVAVSGGWMLMSFWDLGLQETGSIGATPNLDDSNILGFDGFFVRGEMVF